MSLIIFIIILGILVLVHELGHFIAAKLNGIKVDEFGFGFPPRLFGIKKGETLYSVNALPIGGFVKLYGEEYYEMNNKKKTKDFSRAFINKKPYQKAIVIIGGVFMNVVLAVVIYYGILAFSNFSSDLIPLPIPYKFRFGLQEGRVVIAGVVKGSPAQKANIMAEEAVYGINKHNIFIPITSSKQMIDIIKNSPSTVLEINLENIRNGTKKTVSVTPYYNEELKRPVIGASLVDAAILSYQSPKNKMFSGFYHSYNMFAYNASMMKYLVSSSFKEKNIAPVSQTVSGPVGIFKIINEIVTTSGQKLFINILNLIALLSLSLAFINIFPFPALDGGRLVFVLFEWVTGKRVNHKVEQYVNLAGFLFLISLAILITISDVVKIFVK